MCSPSGRTRLAAFIRWAMAQRTPERDVHLVVAGDIVDFLAEKEFSAFTSNDADACDKLKNVFLNFAEVWDAFRAFTASGAALTLMLGNHDVELALPGPHRLLLERLGVGRVDFIVDNQAFVDGPVLIEHGNRYDMWNAVPHDLLRQVRSALSRREEPPQLPDIPGSRLVVSVMNDLKRDYAFIDLLKPETEAALPLLAVLKPSAIWEIGKVIQLYRRASRVRFDEAGVPTEPGLISAGVATNEGRANTERAWREAQELAGVKTDEGQISALDSRAAVMTTAFVDLWRAARAVERDVQIDRLYRGLKTFAAEQGAAFDIGRESETYLTPARELARRGFDVIVFGHTHFARRVPLAGVNRRAVYFNSGTWADIIRLPASLLSAEEAAAKSELMTFADDLAHNQLESWRTQTATFVRINLADDKADGAEVYLFQDGERTHAIRGGKES